MLCQLELPPMDLIGSNESISQLVTRLRFARGKILLAARTLRCYVLDALKF
jgi:hypothetical protein